VLVSPHVSLAHEIEAGGAGWISEVNAEGLRATLATALGDDDDRRRRGEAARNLARNFDWKEIADSLVRLYESVIASAGK